MGEEQDERERPRTCRTSRLQSGRGVGSGIALGPSSSRRRVASACVRPVKLCSAFIPKTALAQE
ncbi:Hypothetical protein A7982_11080 [Minicystis rosea]|nr:Hypothetical protein A7982_11080 [Minicystis rosea]